MKFSNFTWPEELAIIDRTMKAISGMTDPEELVGVYWEGIGELSPIQDYVAVSRRGVEPPYYLVTRSAVHRTSTRGRSATACPSCPAGCSARSSTPTSR